MKKKPKHQGIPPEIVCEILANLPVKTLIRFRCVCKLWSSLISDSSFQRQHHHRRLQQDPLLLIASTDSVNEDTHADTLDLSTHDGNVGIDIAYFSIPFPVSSFSFTCDTIQICQGLACVSLSTDVFVCNPATREIIAVPSFGEEPNRCVGFGYAASTKEFKVVQIFSHSLTSETNNCCEIFTLGTSEWREARCTPPDSFSELSFHAPFLHGAVHFLSDSEDLFVDDVIYAFDIESEQFTKIPFPKDFYVARESVLSLDWRLQCLNEFRGSLCLTSSCRTSMQLWFLKDYNSGNWVKEYVINLSQMSFTFIRGEPLAIIGDGRILLKIFQESRNEQIWWYNPGDKTFQETWMEDHTATMYVESLLPLAFPHSA